MAARGFDRVRQIRGYRHLNPVAQTTGGHGGVDCQDILYSLLSRHPLHFLSSSRGCGNGGKTAFRFSTVSIARGFSLALLSGEQHRHVRTSAQVDFAYRQVPEGHQQLAL